MGFQKEKKKKKPPNKIIINLKKKRKKEKYCINLYSKEEPLKEITKRNQKKERFMNQKLTKHPKSCPYPKMAFC